MNTRTAESLVVEVDSAIVLANLMLLLGIFLYQFPSLPTEPAKHIKLTIKSSLNGQSQQPSSVLTKQGDVVWIDFDPFKGS